MPWPPHRWHRDLEHKLRARIQTEGGLVLLSGPPGAGATRLIDRAHDVGVSVAGDLVRHVDLRGASTPRLVRELEAASQRRSGVAVVVWAHRLDDALQEIGIEARRGLRARVQQGELTMIGTLQDRQLLHDDQEPFFFGAHPVTVQVPTPAPEGDPIHDLLAACLGWRVAMVERVQHHVPTPEAGRRRGNDAGQARTVTVVDVDAVARALGQTLDTYAARYDLEAARLGATGEAVVHALTELARPPSSSTLAWAINRSPQLVSNALRDLGDAGVVTEAHPETTVGWQVTNWRLADPLWAARRGRALLFEWVAQTALVRVLHERTTSSRRTWVGDLHHLSSYIAPLLATDPPTPDSARRSAREPVFLPPPAAGAPSDGQPPALPLQVDQHGATDGSLPPTVDFPVEPVSVLRGGRRMAAPWLSALLDAALPDAGPFSRQLALVVAAYATGAISQTDAANAVTATRTLGQSSVDRELADHVFRIVTAMATDAERTAAGGLALEVGGHALATLVDAWLAGEFG